MLDHPGRLQVRTRSIRKARAPAPGLVSFVTWMPTAGCLESCSAATYQANDAVMQSWVHFLCARSAKQCALPQQMAACHSVGDLSIVCTQFWQQAAADYTTELMSIAGLGWNAFQTILEASQDNVTDSTVS